MGGSGLELGVIEAFEVTSLPLLRLLGPPRRAIKAHLNDRAAGRWTESVTPRRSSARRWNCASEAYRRRLAQAALFEGLEVFYNWARGHRALGDQTPVDFEFNLN